MFGRSTRSEWKIHRISICKLIDMSWGYNFQSRRTTQSAVPTAEQVADAVIRRLAAAEATFSDDFSDEFRPERVDWTEIRRRLVALEESQRRTSGEIRFINQQFSNISNNL
jgi:hypothetical protein